MSLRRAGLALLASACVLLLQACGEQTTGGLPNGYLTVWSNSGLHPVVFVDGQLLGPVGDRFAGIAPDGCNQAGTVTAHLNVGEHQVHAEAGTTVWNETVTISEGVCSILLLGGPVVPATVQLMIWTNYAYGIDVKVDGIDRGSLTRAFTNGAPSCGAAGTIMVTVAPGQHVIAGTGSQDDPQFHSRLTWGPYTDQVDGSTTCARFELQG